MMPRKLLLQSHRLGELSLTNQIVMASLTRGLHVVGITGLEGA